MSANKPVLTLNMDDKIYLAVAKRDLDKLAFVYTLACLKSDKNANNYSTLATSEIHAFRNKTSADIYYKSISQLVEINEKDKTKKILFNMNDKLIESFMEKTK